MNLYIAHYTRNVSRKGSPVTFQNVYQVPQDEREEGVEPTNCISQFGPVTNNVVTYSGMFDSEVVATVALRAHIQGINFSDAKDLEQQNELFLEQILDDCIPF